MKDVKSEGPLAASLIYRSTLDKIFMYQFRKVNLVTTILIPKWYSLLRKWQVVKGTL